MQLYLQQNKGGTVSADLLGLKLTINLSSGFDLLNFIFIHPNR